LSNSYSLKDSRYCAIDVEELVLGCLILNDTFFDYRLEENDFCLLEHKIIYKAILSLKKVGHKISPILIKYEIIDNEDYEVFSSLRSDGYLFELANTAYSPELCVEFAEILHDRSGNRIGKTLEKSFKCKKNSKGKKK